VTLIPTQITFRGMPHSEALEADIREHVAWLERFHHRNIVRCHVVVEVPHRHRDNGRSVHVTIELTVPAGTPIVISHEPSLHGALKQAGTDAYHKDDQAENVHRYATVAVREAFAVARRRLEDFSREQRGLVKVHEVPAHGEVVELSGVDGFGFIQSGENRIYFARPSVVDDAFDSLTIGTRVAFVEELGEKGPQASAVRVLGRHHYVAP
jgi:cold shock CspA family protein